MTEWNLTTDTTAGRTITLPLVATRYEGALAYNCTVDWGDGTTSTVTSSADSRRIHIYSTTGYKSIAIYGTCEGWSINYSADRTKITRVLDWGKSGDFNGFKYLKNGFNGCTNLVGIADDRISASGTGVLYDGFEATFSGCTKLASIPSGLFDYHPSVTNRSFMYTFSGCTSITTIPRDLFKYHTLLVGSFNYTFQSCNIKFVPDDLFRYNANIRSGEINYTFRYCVQLETIPVDLYRYNTLIDSLAGVFDGCYALQKIPDLLLRYNSSVGSVSQLFNNCMSITTIPTDLFKYTSTTGGQAFFATFNNCQNIEAIPVDLFRYKAGCTMDSFSGTFTNCYKISSIPIDLFRYNTLVSGEAFRSTFSGCRTITQIPDDLFRYNTESGSFYATFSNCVNIPQIPVDLFKYNTKLASNGMYSTFGGCVLITAIPVDIFRYNVSSDSAGSCFSNTGITSIPVDIFRYNTYIYSFGSTFTNTPIVSLPADLFKYNVRAYYCLGTFYGCYNLETLCAELFKYSTFDVSYTWQSFDYTEAFRNCIKLQLRGDIFYSEGQQGTRFLNYNAKFTRCFDRASFSGVQGTAPDLWNCNFGNKTPVKTDCFNGAGNDASSISNYASIPAAWL
jgi:hypothetical protein